MLQVPPSPGAITQPVQQIAVWRAGSVTCDGRVLTSARVPDSAPVLRWTSGDVPATLPLSFTISPDGRPLDIMVASPGYRPQAEDIAPALATARFAGGARTRCSVSYSLSSRPIADASLADVLAVAMWNGNAPSLRARIDAASGDCVAPYPTPTLRAYPDLVKLPRLPGALSWTVTRFDIDEGGRPVRLSTAAGSGNAALDRAAIDAIARSRFAGGVRHGCLLPTRLGPATLTPPSPPAAEAMRPAGATCPAELPFAKPPMLTMPQAWQRRSIEGWAIVAYDVAPWGAIGNARVLAAQPAAAFGDWALNVLRTATKATTNAGYVGCVDRIIFRISNSGPERVIVSPTPID